MRISCVKQNPSECSDYTHPMGAHVVHVNISILIKILVQNVTPGLLPTDLAQR